jgi:hypothetical protein
MSYRLLLRLPLVPFFLAILIGGCKSSVKDTIDIANGIERKKIDTSRLAVNAFVNDGRFGSIPQQFSAIRSTLGIHRVRVLMAWDDNVQPTPAAEQNFSFYDDVIAGLAPGQTALIVVTDVPSWMNDRANWTAGDGGRTFVERWVEKVVDRYGDNPSVVGFQIGNEPNNPSFSMNQTLGLLKDPIAYVAILARAYSVIQSRAPSKKTVIAATTALNQGFPQTRDYNRAMRDAGAGAFCDVWAAHIYGRQFENIVRDGGVADFLNGLDKPVWITESGAQGTTNQLKYGEQMWPFLLEKIRNIEHIFIYQYTDSSPADISYGLRTLDPANPVSDLFVHLRDRVSE